MFCDVVEDLLIRSTLNVLAFSMPYSVCLCARARVCV